jgi:hypothetical protein
LLGKWNLVKNAPKLVYVPWSQEEEDELQKLKEKEFQLKIPRLGNTQKMMENHQLVYVHNMDDCGIERFEMEIQLRKRNANNVTLVVQVRAIVAVVEKTQNKNIRYSLCSLFVCVM